VALKVIGCVPVCPTVTSPKFSGAGAIVNWPGEEDVPVPVTGIVTPPFGNITLPLAAPDTCGANVTLKLRDCFGARIIGKFSPLAVNPVPVISTCVTRMKDDPELVTETGRVALDPTATLPNPRTEGVGVIDSFATPAPPTKTLSEGFAALLPKVMVPPVDPTTVGVNVKLTLTLSPGATVNGRLTSDEPKLETLEVRLETVIGVDPILVKVTGIVSVWFRLIVPNLTVLGVQASCPVAASELVGRKPIRRIVMLIK
jgi:hypothetical protein